MVSRRVYGYLILAAAFVVGAACGGSAAFAYAARRHATLLREDTRGLEVRRLRVLTRKLDLDGGQQDRIRTILSKDRDELRGLGREMLERCGGPLRDQKARVEADIRSVLRPDQQKIYDGMLDERRERLWLGPGFSPRRGGDPTNELPGAGDRR